LQIGLGAPVLVEIGGKNLNPLEIAELEFKQKRFPITVKRKLPSGEEVVINIKKAIENWLKEER
jgi:DNA-directed RNA polymerase subunit K/omega